MITEKRSKTVPIIPPNESMVTKYLNVKRLNELSGIPVFSICRKVRRREIRAYKLPGHRGYFFKWDEIWTDLDGQMMPVA